MDQSPSKMMIHPKSLEKAQYELGTRIKRQLFVARTPQQNGFVERKNRTV